MTTEEKLSKLGLIINRGPNQIKFEHKCNYCNQTFDKNNVENLKVAGSFHMDCYNSYLKTGCGVCEHFGTLFICDKKTICLDGFCCTEGCYHIDKVYTNTDVFSKGYSCKLCYNYCCNANCLLLHLRRKHYDIIINNKKSISKPYKVKVHCPLCRKISADKTYYITDGKMFIRTIDYRDYVLSNKICEPCSSFVVRYHTAKNHNYFKRMRELNNNKIPQDNNDFVTNDIDIPPYVHYSLNVGFTPLSDRFKDLYFIDFANYLMNSNLPKFMPQHYNNLIKCNSDSVIFLKDIDCQTVGQLISKLGILINNFNLEINSRLNNINVTSIIIDYQTWQLIPFYKTLSLIMEGTLKMIL